MKHIQVKRIRVGDLVEIKKTSTWYDSIKRGFVIADETAWWMIKNHFDINHNIIHEKELKVIVKQVIPKKYQRYLY